MTPRRVSFVAALFFMGRCAAWGQQASPTPFPPPFTMHGPQGMIGVLAYFLLIVALLAGGLYLTRSGFRFVPRTGKGERKLVISETRTLGNRQFLIIAEYENRKMLLGVCPGKIEYLSTLAGGGDEAFSTVLPDKE